MTYRCQWSTRVRVKVVSDTATLYTGAAIKRRAVIYHEVGHPDKLTVREWAEFRRTFQPEQ